MCSFKILISLLCRSDVEEGGETVFPAATGNVSPVAGWNGMSECAKEGLPVKPRMGDALLFWSMRPDTTLDPSSLHGELFSLVPSSSLSCFEKGSMQIDVLL